MSRGYPGWENYKAPAGKTKRSKYRAERTEVDGLKFASRREAARYETLLLDQKAGLISELEVQPQFPLYVIRPNGVTVVIARYLADFRYQRDGREVVEDAKGMRTEAYVLKKKFVEAQYGIEIVEV